MNEPTDREIAVFLAGRIDEHPRHWRFLSPKFRDIVKAALLAYQAEPVAEMPPAEDSAIVEPVPTPEPVKRGPGRPSNAEKAARMAEEQVA